MISTSISNNRFKRLRFVIALFFLVIFSCPTHPALAQGIVVLHSEYGPTPWTQGIIAGLISELGERTEIRQEHLGGEDMNEEHFDSEYERLSRVHANTSPEAVVASGEIAFAFMRKYRETLFSDAPVVFCSMPRPGPELLRQCGDCTGVPLDMDVSDTVDLIFATRPDTRLVVGIMDATPTSLSLRKSMEQAMTPYLDHAQLIFPGHEPGDNKGLDMETLDAVASSIPASGAVLFLGFQEDRTGKAVNDVKAVRMLSKQSAGPVFVLLDTWIGQEVLGGFVATGKNQGSSAAKLIKRILAGEPAEEMLPQPPQPQLVADATVLARFGIQAQNIPLLQTAQLVNKPVRPTETDTITSSGILSAALGLVALAALLYLLRRLTCRKCT
jgi:hypothetical protein